MSDHIAITDLAYGQDDTGSTPKSAVRMATQKDIDKLLG